MILETIPELWHLSIEQKVQLSMELAEEVSAALETRHDFLETLDQRLDTYESGPDQVKTMEEVTAGPISRGSRLNTI